MTNDHSQVMGANVSQAHSTSLAIAFDSHKKPFTLWVERFVGAAPFIFLTLLSVAFVWKVSVLGQVLVPTDILSVDDPLWQPHTLDAVARFYTGAANLHDFDVIAQFYPWAALSSQALHQGTVPLWNPYAFTGTPFLASMQPGFFYPINAVLEWLLPPADVLGIRAMSHIALASIGTFLFARRLTLSRLASCMAAIAFGLSLPYIVWLQHPISAAFSWLPWLLLCIDYVIATRGSLRWFVATATVAAVEMLAGHGETTAHVALLCAAYALFRLYLVRRQSRIRALVVRPVIVLVVAVVLGTAVAAVQLLPTLAQLPHSFYADKRAATNVSLLGEPSRWVTLILALVPNFFGSPTWHNVLLLPSSYNYNEIALYVGIVPLLLAIVALIYRHDAFIVFFAATAVVTLGIAMRLPILGLGNVLPGLRLADNGRLRVEYAFAVAMLAGFGVDALSQASKGKTLWRLARLLSVALIVIVTPSIVLLHIYPALFTLLRTHMGLAVVALHIYPGLDQLLHISHQFYALPYSTTLFSGLPVVWLLVFTIALWLHRRGMLSLSALQAAAITLTAFDLFSLGSGYHSAVSYRQAVATPLAVHAIQEDTSLYRVAGLGSALLPSQSSLFGLQDIRGYDPTYDISYAHFVGKLFSITPEMQLYLTTSNPGDVAQTALNLMNVKYIVAACSIHLNMKVYRPLYRGIGCVYRNTEAMPRAFLVHQVQWATTSQALALLGTRGVDLHHVVLLDPATADRKTWTMPIPAKDMQGDSVRITHYGLNQVDLLTHSSTRGALVLSDAFATGWTARIDGHSTSIARADGAFRGLLVQAGTHHISFDYEPDSFTVALPITLGALALLLLLSLAVLWARLFQRKHQLVPQATLASAN